MLIQSLILIGTMFILTGAILTSTLLSAKAVLHQTMLTKTQTAMSDATQAFVASTQQFVQLHGTEQQKYPVPKPTTESLCAPSAGATCQYLATMAWQVTGTSAQVIPTKASGSAPADAQYLATTVDEQRISATLSVAVTNATGKTVYSERSREVTARIFNAAPYVVVTGTRDLAESAGSIRSSEGDTGGSLADRHGGQLSAQPDAMVPSRFTDTRILTSIDCANSATDTGRPIAKAYFDKDIRPYGNLAWAFESSCTSAKGVNKGIPIGYHAPSGPLFVANPTVPDSAWQKGDESAGTYAR